MKEKATKSSMRHAAAFALAAALAVFGTTALVSCDSPTGAGGGVTDDGGTGSITISLNTGNASNSAARTAVPDSAELAGITFKVHLTGPGGTIDRDFGPQGGTIELASGTWNITVKAYNNEPRLRGIADQTISVRPGGSQTIAVTSAIGVKNETELRDVLDPAVALYRYNDSDLSRENLIVLEADVDLNDSLIISDVGITNPRKYTIIAEPGTTRTIYRRAGSGNGAYISMDDGALTLGRAGETGSLVIDGMGTAYNPGSAFFYIYNNASLIIDGNTEITSMNDSSVGATIWCDSLVEMRGGKITNCTNTNDGGAVTIRGSGRFVMSGGEISGNSAPDGGGIAITNAGFFEMSGGLISGNSASYGGGVFLAGNALAFSLGDRTFTMSGGEISGNTASANGGGVYLGVVNVLLSDINSFTMTDGLISGNSSAGLGKGDAVFVDYMALFAKRGGTITSTNPSREMVYVLTASTERFATAGPTVRLYYNGRAASGTETIDPLDGFSTAANWY